jgi:hypothetical protein
MVIRSPICQTDEAGSPPRQVNLPNLVLEPEQGNIRSTTNSSSGTFPEESRIIDLPIASSLSTMTGQGDLLKASFSSSVLDSTIEEEDITICNDESLQPNNKNNNSNNTLPSEESYHLITPVKPDSVLFLPWEI